MSLTILSAKELLTIEQRLNYKFNDSSLLEQALTHCSYLNEHKDIAKSNERLEFLGDSVLGLIISEYLYEVRPHQSEGELSSFRAKLVQAAACALYLKKLNISDYLLVARGETLHGKELSNSVLADLFEAIVAAIYLDKGLDAAKNFLFKNFASDFDQILNQPQDNWKTILQEFCQKIYHTSPIYEIISEKGPDHNKIFEVTVSIENKVVGTGFGKSKKLAEREAASFALKKLNY